MIPLEDFFEDIIAKTMRGRGITEAELAAKTGESPDLLARLCRGEFCDEGALPKVARALDLDADALVVCASKAWYPRAVTIDGLEGFSSNYRDMKVNAFLIWDPNSKQAACFDTGTDCQPLLRRADQLGLTLERVFLTHTHNDHVADLPRLTRELGDQVQVYCNKDEPWPSTVRFSEGDSFSIGELTVETRTVSGHSAAGTAYFVKGLAKPVAVVGDAIFAGSMGGGFISFQDAWDNNLSKILTLPDETVLCPGHGPMSSVAEEKRYNPFFANQF